MERAERPAGRHGESVCSVRVRDSSFQSGGISGRQTPRYVLHIHDELLAFEARGRGSDALRESLWRRGGAGVGSGVAASVRSGQSLGRSLQERRPRVERLEQPLLGLGFVRVYADDLLVLVPVVFGSRARRAGGGFRAGRVACSGRVRAGSVGRGVLAAGGVRLGLLGRGSQLVAARGRAAPGGVQIPYLWHGRGRLHEGGRRALLLRQLLSQARRVEDDLSEGRADANPALHARDVPVSVHHEGVRSRHVAGVVAEHDNQGLQRDVRVRDDLVVRGARLRHDHGVPLKALLHLVSGSTAEI